MTTEPNYHCPICGTRSQLVIGPTQAFCTNRVDCGVVTFDPSLSDGGLSDMHVIDFKWDVPKPEETQ